MKYTIISVTDNREHYKAEIREQLREHEEVTGIDFVGYEHDHWAILQEYGLSIYGYRPTVGELGIWLSQIRCWKWAVEHQESLIVFEDDAIVRPGFDEWYSFVTEPEIEYDVFSLFVPDNQRGDFELSWVGNAGIVYPGGSPNHVIGHPKLARAYQGYGGVCIQVTPEGAQKMLDGVKELGIYQPIDCWIFERGFPDFVRKGPRLEIVTPQPEYANGVTVDWNAETTIHTTPYFEVT